MVNKKILILCGHYADGKYSNSICVKNLAEWFAQNGHIVKVIAWGEKDSCFSSKSGVEICYIKEPQYPLLVERFLKKGGLLRILFMLFHAIRGVFMLPIYPNITPGIAKRYYKSAKKIIKSDKIDTILATYTPYDGIWAGMKLKKEFGDSISFVTYHLDLMSSPDNSGMIRAFKVRRNQKAFEKELKYADKVLVPESAHVEAHPKIKIVGFPLYVMDGKNAVSAFIFPHDSVNLTYIGSLSSSNRSPSVAIEAISRLKEIEGKKLIFHIWGILGDKECEDAVKRSPYVVYHGMAKNDEVADLLSKSDFLLNISNGTTYKMIPSKIFQYFAASKPILNFVKHADDASVPYFERYGHSLQINEQSALNHDNLNRIKEFLNDKYRKEILVEKNLFEKSTPQYICNVIMN